VKVVWHLRDEAKRSRRVGRPEHMRPTHRGPSIIAVREAAAKPLNCQRHLFAVAGTTGSDVANLAFRRAIAHMTCGTRTRSPSAEVGHGAVRSVWE
jgi:hypothetical protein